MRGSKDLAYYLIDVQQDKKWLPRRVISVDITFRTLIDNIIAFTDDFPDDTIRIKRITRAQRDQAVAKIEDLWLDKPE